MILTLTPNPALDRTLQVDSLARGEVHRACGSSLEPGGKGVNVTRALRNNGTASTAVLPTGGNTGPLIERLLRLEELPAQLVPIHGDNRVNTAIVEPDGTTTKINEAGPTLDDQETQHLLAAVDRALDDASWLALCGALAPGMDPQFYCAAIELAHRHDVRTAVDTSGSALGALLDAHPDLIKPNRVELAEVIGHDLQTVGTVIDAASELVQAGIGIVAVSLGKDGALAVSGESVVHAWADGIAPVSTVGAGDSLLAGMLHALESDPDLAGALRTGVAWGAAAVQLPGSRVPRPDEIRGISVKSSTTFDRNRTLTD